MSWKKKYGSSLGELGMKYKLENLLTIKYGKNQKKVVDENGTIPILGTGGIMGWAKEHLYDKPSVLIPRKGSISKVRYIDEPFWTVDTLFYSIINEELVLPKYLYYNLSRIDFNHYNEGTTIPSLRTQTLNNIEIEIHPLTDQKRIVTMLDGIENKIELNNQINQTLEDMAQAIFKHWFVDFEFPNVNGEPYKASGGKFVESELGMIPEGWGISNIGEVAYVKGGKRLPKGKMVLENKTLYPYLRVKDFTKMGIDFESICYISSDVQEVIKNYTISSDDLYISVAGTIGLVGLVPQTLSGANFTENAAKISSRNNQQLNKYFIYLYLTSSEGQKQIQFNTVGSTQPKLPLYGIKNIRLVIPDKELLKAFTEIIEKLYKLKEIGAYNSYTLKELRDTLLPKLMSGEVRISDAEQEVEACLQKSN